MRPPTEKRFENLRRLEEKTATPWPSLMKAIQSTEEELLELERILLPSGNRPLAENVSLVFFGSLARGESTSQSDLDWTLLINGEVDGQHSALHQSIRKKLRDAKKIPPGSTGTFGGLAFSHELVHRIGGQDDTNNNLTLRMLLLLESLSIGNDQPRQMVIRAVLSRYLADDPSWTWRSDGKLPRFLLNDVIRFWRTMAVDFADKFHDQEGEKWALRNAKLRFPRRLILLTGMLACFSWLLHDRQGSSALHQQTIEEAITHFETYFSRPPLEILADELMRADAAVAICRSIFSTYDRFLAILDDETSRNELQTIAREHADRSKVFQEVRTISHEFRDALLNWLYTPNTKLYELVKQYGLF